MRKINDNIDIVDTERRLHSKASEEYIEVRFKYPDGSTWQGWVPVEYRRTGVSIKSPEELKKHLLYVYESMNPDNFDKWKASQDEFWKTKNAKTTKPFFDTLIKGGWQCVECTLPKNPNWARRIQDLKEFGYTLATDTKRYCDDCKANKTHILLLPVPRGISEINGYETWSPKLRKRIISALDSIDVYENKTSPHSLPDHKFSEIRWGDDTKSINNDDMTEDDIKHKFQLLTNQRNQQKREVCRTCYQTNKRGYPFGIKYYYKGTEDWDESIPTTGKEAEKGCIGCGWYDLEKWRDELLKGL